MNTRSTPAVKAVEAAGVAFRLLEYDYGPNAEAVGLQAAEAMGAKHADVADPAKAERSIGYVVGDISPLSQRKRLRTAIDTSANALDEMVVNGRRRGLQIAVRAADLIEILGASVHALT
jgi:Cys-tRNA(Pro)/Cys-tRNA(Cys) deacylase